MKKTSAHYREEYAAEAQAMRDLVDACEAEDREFSPDEQAQFNEHRSACDTLNQSIEAAEAIETCRHLETESDAGGFQFRDSEGRELRAYRHGEPLAERQHRCGEREVSVGEHIYGLVTGRVSEESRAQLGGSVTQGGYLLSDAVSREIIDLARSASVAMRAGTQTLPIEGVTRIARVSQDPTTSWRAETQQVVASDVLFDAIELRPKTIACLVPISVELAEDSVGVTQQIESVIASAMGQAIDQAILTGSGAANEPLGVRNDPTVNAQTSVGTPSDFTDLSSAITTIQSANFNGDVGGLSWISHPRDRNTYDDLVDTTNQPLMPTPMTAQLQQFTTTSLSITEGGGGAESSMLVGDFSQVVLDMRTNITMQILDAGSATDANSTTWNATDQLLRWIRVYARMDVGILRPTWHVVLSGVTNT